MYIKCFYPDSGNGFKVHNILNVLCNIYHLVSYKKYMYSVPRIVPKYSDIQLIKKKKTSIERREIYLVGDRM